MRCLPPEHGSESSLRALRLCLIHAVACTLVLATFALSPQVVRAQSGSEDSRFRPVSDGPGVQFRTGHIAFPTFGRETSITHAELFPYLFDDNQMFFADGRLFVNNYGRLGGNLGFGYRTRPWGGSNIFGASLWWDADDSVDKLYQDVGLSLEHYSDIFDVRLNGYVPVGNTTRQIADRLTNPHFAGNSLLYDRVLVSGVALGGVDYEVGMPLPSTVLRQHNLRAYLGAYHFGGNGVDMISGAKARVEGSIIPSIEGQLAVTSDSYFGTNVTLGVSWSYFGGFKRTETTHALRYDRMGEFVNRNYNVIVAKRRDVTPDLVAINALTNQPFVIQHVGPGGNSSGAPDDPWGTITDAQTAGGDVIIVHAGTVLTEPIVLHEGETLIGQGDGFQDCLNVAGYGAVAIPKVGDNSNAPIIQSASGNAVTLADNSVFAGFVIDSPTGHGIFADGVNNTYVSNVQINNAGGDGILLQNGTGSLLFSGVEINGVTGTGLHIIGGSANVGYTGKIETTSGHSIQISDTTDGLINLTGTTTTEDGGDGVKLLNNDADIILHTLNVTNASGVGVEIHGGDGDVTLAGTSTITDASGTGLLIDNRGGQTLVNNAVINGADGRTAIELADNDGETWFNRVEVAAENATAVYARDSERLTIASGSVASDGGAALDLEGTDVNMVLNNVTASGGAFGIRIVNAGGVFALANTNAYGSGGLIEGADVGVILSGIETVGIAGLDLTGNGIGLQAEDVEQMALTNVRVTDSTSYGLKLLDVGEFHSVNSQYLNNGSLDATILYEASQSGAYVFAMNRNTIEANTGDGIRIAGLAGASNATLNFSFQENVLVTHADFADAVDLTWNGVLLANAITNGIQVNGDHGSAFNVSTTGASLAQMSFGNNVILLSGGEGTALMVNTANPSELIIGGNQIQFDGAGGTGLDFSLAQSADVAVLSNTIVDTAGGGTGMLFRSLAGPSVIEIESNTLNFQGSGALIDRGIIFQSITDVVTLKGVKSNSILNATTPFFVPAGTTQGKININGQNLP